MKIKQILIFFLIISWEVHSQFYRGYDMPFGRSRVQYAQQFIWNQWRTSHYDVFYYQGGKKLAEYVINIANDEIKDLASFFNYLPERKFFFILYNNKEDFLASNVGYTSDEGINLGGITKVVGFKIVVYFNGDHEHLRKQIREGLARIFLQTYLYGENLSSKGVSNFSFLKLRVFIKSKYFDSPVLRNVKIFYVPINSEPMFKNFSYSIKDEFINLEWDCRDSDGDDLVFDVLVKGYKSTEWQKLNSLPISEQKFSINRYLVGDGYFDFKVVASDELTNPKGFAKTNFSIIRNVMIDITPPSIDPSSVRIVKSADSFQVGFRVVDNILIKEVRYSIDGQNWYYVLSEDGVIDSPVESFKLSLPLNSRVLIIRIVDGQGNTKVERIDL